MTDLFDFVCRSTEGCEMIRDVGKLPTGYVQIETGFLYPDGTSIEVFVRTGGQQRLDGALELSDLGQTFGWLHDVQVKPWQSKKRKMFVDDSLELFGASSDGGEIKLIARSMGELMGAVFRLGQACARVSDLTVTKRAVTPSMFVESVESLIVDTDLPYEPDVALLGRSRSVRVDFLIIGPRRESAILTLSSGHTAQAHTAANEIFTRWFDLSKRNEQRITVYNDDFNVYRDEDLERLREFSEVIASSDSDRLRESLAA